MLKTIVTVIVSGYLGAGLFGGLVMQTAVPAMNTFGVAAYAVSWPGFLYCARSDFDDCQPFRHIPLSVQGYMFDL
jgi:hypothetical protein